MTQDDVMRRFVINRVMCLLRLDLREVAEKFGPGRAQGARGGPREGRRELQDDGLVTFDGEVLKVTPLGQLLVRNVAMLFDAYLGKHAGEKKPTFSRTI